MAVEVRQFSPTIPANTPQSVGWSADMSVPPRVVEGIDIRVPPGPGGYVGFYIGTAGVQVIPANAGQFIITDNEVITWDLTGQLNSGSWTFYAYNTGGKAHTIYVRFRLGLVVPRSAVFAPTLIPASTLEAAP